MNRCTYFAMFLYIYLVGTPALDDAYVAPADE